MSTTPPLYTMVQRLSLLVLLLATATVGRAQVVSVGPYRGFADATTKTVLVSIPADEDGSAALANGSAAPSDRSAAPSNGSAAPSDRPAASSASPAAPSANPAALAASSPSLPSTVVINDEEYTVETTTLPLLRLEHGNVGSDAFVAARLTLIDPSAETIDLPVEVRYRGATSLAYHKKNYAVKLLDPTTGESLDEPLLGMRSDNSWVLDAMASDMARMRNRVSTDIWLDFAQRPYYADSAPTMTNGTHGRFVEAFVGDRYWGLYCLTEKVDRKQLRLKKFKDGQPRGILYKSYRYDDMRRIIDPDPSPLSSTWQGWEASYPDVRKGEPFDWTPLYNVVDFLSIEPPDFDLLDFLWQRVDIPLWRDYNLFCDLLHADDNVCKNMYVYYPDITQPADVLADPNGRPVYPAGTIVSIAAPGPLCICPWDLDATWGRTYDRQPIDPTENCNVANWVNYQMWVSQRDGGRSIIDRWAHLRAKWFRPETLWPYFERYFSLFASSGAAARETQRWDGIDGVHLDFDAEARFIHDWIGRRITYLDGDYLYHDEGIVSLRPADQACPAVYTLDGRRVATQKSPKPLGPGLYIEGGKKKFIR